MSVSPEWELAALCLVAGGIPTTISSVVSTTLLQTTSSGEHRGRITGLYSGCAAGGLLIGTPLAGLLAAACGPRSGLAVGAAVFGAAGALAVLAFPALAAAGAAAAN